MSPRNRRHDEKTCLVVNACSGFACWMAKSSARSYRAILVGMAPVTAVLPSKASEQGSWGSPPNILEGFPPIGGLFPEGSSTLRRVEPCGVGRLPPAAWKRPLAAPWTPPVPTDRNPSLGSTAIGSAAPGAEATGSTSVPAIPVDDFTGCAGPPAEGGMTSALAALPGEMLFGAFSPPQSEPRIERESSGLMSSSMHACACSSCLTSSQTLSDAAGPLEASLRLPGPHALLFASPRRLRTGLDLICL